MNEQELIEYFINNPLTAGERLGGGKFNPRESAFLFIGLKAFDEENFEVAIEYYTKAIKEQPENWISFSQRAICYRMINQFDKSISDALESKKIDDNYINNQTLALCYLYKKEYKTAIKYFDITVNSLRELNNIDNDYGATMSRALSNQSICYYNLKQLNNAIICTTKGMIANPQYSNNYFIRGVIYWESGHNDDARKDLEMALKYGDERAADILKSLQ